VTDVEPPEDLVKLDRNDTVVILTLNNPKRMNAFSAQMRQQFHDHLVELAGDASCRAIILTGAGGNLCTGGDISTMQRRELLERRASMDITTRVFRLIIGHPKPIICAAEGNVMGVGVSMVAACDYAVASRDAQFRCAFIKMGLIPDLGGIWSLPRKIGYRKAMELCALAELVDAESAQRIQLVNEVSEPGGALGRALEVARKFAAAPPTAMAMLKSALNIGSESIDRAVSTENDYQALLQTTDDHLAAVERFKSRKKE